MLSVRYGPEWVRNTNPAAKKAPKKQPKTVTTKAKKAPATVLKGRKAPVKAKSPLKKLVRCVIEAPIEEGVAQEVVVTNRSKRTIKLPVRYI